ncbi:lipase secretion chaperone [Luteimonas panaciterrae]|uniref:lipase secretion chaperone n=1 Tax=Luteimonas panaciterrae TaxID=363885 RepID=UPI001CFBF3B4|nr:lipase secretion chaperone [Luteimonas panaciterrae]
MALAFAAGAVWWGQRPAQTGISNVDASMTNAGTTLGTLASMSEAETIALPPYLQGRVLSELPIDEHGHLLRSLLVRDWFEQYLVARNEMRDAHAMDALVGQEIVRQASGLPACGEALALWLKYQAYKAALTENGSLADGTDVDGLRVELERRRRLREKYLGDWAVPLFGEEDHNDQRMVARMAIVTRPGLNVEERTKLLMEFDSTNRIRSADANVADIAQMLSQGISYDRARAAITQRMGAEAAARFDQIQEQEQSWQSNYQAYVRGRKQITAQKLPTSTEEVQLGMLRERFFADPADFARASALDRIAEQKMGQNSAPLH